MHFDPTKSVPNFNFVNILLPLFMEGETYHSSNVICDISGLNLQHRNEVNILSFVFLGGNI
jgi:hypothetical protein